MFNFMFIHMNEDRISKKRLRGMVIRVEQDLGNGLIK